MVSIVQSHTLSSLNRTGLSTHSWESRLQELPLVRAFQPWFSPDVNYVPTGVWAGLEAAGKVHACPCSCSILHPPPHCTGALPQPSLPWGKQEVTLASLLDKMKWPIKSWIKPLISPADHEQTITDHTPAFRRKSCCRISFLQNVPSFHQVWAFTGHCEPENQTCVASEKDWLWPRSHLWVNRTIRCFQSVKANPGSEHVYIRKNIFFFS